MHSMNGALSVMDERISWRDSGPASDGSKTGGKSTKVESNQGAWLMDAGPWLNGANAREIYARVAIDHV